MRMLVRGIACGLLFLLTTTVRAEEMQYPLGAVKTADGSIFVVDLKMHGVWQSKDGTLKKFFEGSPKFRTPLNAPRCIAFDRAGKVLVGDSATRQVYRLDDAGQPTPLVKSGVGIGIPMAIAPDAEGTLFVADLELHKIYKVPAEGGTASEFISISAPRGLTFDADGNLLVLSTTKDQVHRVSKDGKQTLVVPDRPIDFAHNIVVGPDKFMYATDGYGKCVWKISPEGKLEKLVSGAPLVNPVGLSLSGDKLLVTDPRANAVFEVDFAGKLTKLDLGK